MKKRHLFMFIQVLIMVFFLVSCNQAKNSRNETEQIVTLDSSYVSENYDFLFQYPSQWTLQEDPWSSATETSESDPEKTVNLYINEQERIVVFDSHSIDGGLFYLVSGKETEISNILGIKGIMITETLDIEGEDPLMNVLAYYEDGYEEGIGMGGSYGACAMIKKSTYEENKELIIEFFKSIRIKQKNDNF